MRKKFRLVLLWAIFASIWIILVSVLFVVYAFGPNEFKMYEIYTIAILAVFIGTPLFGTAILVLPYSWKGASEIENFMSDFHPTWVKMQVEFGNLVQDEASKNLLNVVTKLMPGYKLLKESSRLSKALQKEIDDNQIIVHKGKKIGILKTIPHGSKLDKEGILDLERNIAMKSKKLRLKLRFFSLVQENYDQHFKEWDDEDKLAKNGAMVLFLIKQGNDLKVKWVSPIAKRPFLH